MPVEQRVALVTGASRGIGKAVAVHLARAGFDVAIGARTMNEGESREHSSTLRASNTKPLPGSLSSTAMLVQQEGRQALPVYLDLLDRASLGVAVTTVLERWGRIDVLVNNGRYIGPGHMDLFHGHADGVARQSIWRPMSWPRSCCAGWCCPRCWRGAMATS